MNLSNGRFSFKLIASPILFLIFFFRIICILSTEEKYGSQLEILESLINTDVHDPITRSTTTFVITDSEGKKN